jgi:hypothetical protein
MRFLRFTFRLLLGALTFLIAMLLALGVWLWRDPQGVWQTAEKYLLPEDLRVSWQDLDFSARRNTWTDWKISWRFTNLSVTKASPAIEAPFDRFNLEFSVRPFSPGFDLRLHDFVVTANKPLRFALPPPGKKSEPWNPYQQVGQIRDYLTLLMDRVDIQKSNIVLDDIRLKTADGNEIRGTVKVKKSPTDSRVSMSADVRGISAVVNRVHFIGLMDLKKFRQDETFLSGEAELSGTLVNAKADLNITNSSEKIEASIQGDLKVVRAHRPISLRPEIKISLSAKEAHVTALTSATGIPGPIPTIANIRGDVKIPLVENQSWTSRPATFAIDTRLALFFIDKDMRPPIEKACRCKIPEELAARLTGQVWPAHLNLISDEVVPLVDARMDLAPISSKLFDVRLGAQLKINRKAQTQLFAAQLDSDFALHSFQGLRQFLDAKGIIVPAPLNVLDGEVRVVADGPVVLSGDGVHTPFSVALDLRSRSQKVKATAVVDVKMHSKWQRGDFHIKTRIQDFQVELPPLDPLVEMPRLRPDPRLLRAPVAKAQPIKGRFTIQLDVETERSGAVRLLSNLARPYVPMTLKIHQSIGGPGTGFVKLEKFNIQYLRRTVVVEFLRVDLNDSAQGLFPLDGRLRIDQTDYRVFVDLGGTTKAPILSLSSQPDLPRSEIISVLLFDRTSNQLVSADSETVGSFEAALADRAIGLFGLWAFSSTPIRSFSYNAITKVYAATLQLDEGLTAQIGTNWESTTSLEVRKRLSRRWVLTASWAPSQEEEEIGKVVLQWERRF